jgi:hypothetical protein
MGLFDYVRSSYLLPEPFMGVNQTKDIDGDGGTLTDYWIDPKGFLWCGSYMDCHTLEFIEEGDPRFDPEKFWANQEWVQTGVHGKFKPFPLTKYIEIYPERFDGPWENWPLLRLHFREGTLLNWDVVK